MAADRLAECEAVIERAQQGTYEEIGRALSEIRDGRLYRSANRTFAEYCQTRWGWQRAHAYRMIAAWEVARDVSPIGDTPASESVARELAPVKGAEERQEIWKQALEESSGKPTAVAVADIRKRHWGGHGTPQFNKDGHPVGSYEWWTPARFMGPIYRVLGGQPDLDPASCAEANQVIKARKFYSERNNGLAHRWAGTVYCNPPYGPGADGERGLARKFTTKLLTECEAGHVTAAILLLPQYVMSTGWFKSLMEASVMCMVTGIIQFDAPGGDSVGNQAGSVFVYLGPDIDAFDREFSPLGAIVYARRSAAERRWLARAAAAA